MPTVHLWRDLRSAVRASSKAPGVTVAAVLALALGIGANTAIFSVVNAVFLRPLPYSEAEQLVQIRETSGNSSISVSYPNYLDWRPQADVFAHMAASAVYDATLESSGSAERVPAAYVSADFFSVFRTKPLLGRDFRAEDDRQGAAAVAILTHRTWQTRYGSNPAILGTPIFLDKRSYTVIGVLPPEFRFYRSSDVFIPISDAITRQMLSLRANHNSLYVVARLKPGATLATAQSQMATITLGLAKAYPDVNTGISAKVESLREYLAGDSRKPVLMLLGAVCLVLLIACVNVANLLLARAADRKKEMALRAALGASRWNVMEQLLSESVLLAVAGGALGTLFATWSFAGLVRLVPASIAVGGLGIDVRVLGFTLAVSIVTGVLFGLAPVFGTARVNLSEAIREGTRSTGGSSRGRLRDALVVSEIALSLVLLVGAGLLLRTLNGLMNVRLGFQTTHLLTARVNLPDDDSVSREQTARFFERLSERVSAIPGVTSAGLISHMPLTGSFSNAVFYHDDRPIPPRGQLPAADQRFASPEYFRTMGLPLLKGRVFTPADGRVTNFRREEMLDWFRKQTVYVVINETMARRFWPGEDPIGKSFRFGFPEMKLPRLTIIGVVGDTRDYGPGQEAPPIWYFSALHLPNSGYTLVIRTLAEPSGLVSSVRRAAAELSPDAMVSDVTTAEQLVSDSVASRRLNLVLLSIFAGLALLLASVGIYGVMAYAVSRRRQEIGVRIAMGAARGDILRLVIGKVAVLGGAGIAIGLVAALGLTRLMASMLYGVKPADPLTFVSVAGMLLAVALAAGYIPALRATRVSPLTALRCE